MRASSQLKVWLAVVGLAVVLGGTGCSNQQEGEWCSKLNNNDDCSAGLACVDRNGTTLCCPEAPAQPSVPQCVQTTGRPASEAGVEAGAQPETDASDASDASEPDSLADTAVVETSTDAAQTVGEAAAIDAPEDAQSSTDVSIGPASDVSSGAEPDASTGGG